jgi:uncharacterized protein YndB with AHSA1/START domain
MANAATTQKSALSLVRKFKAAPETVWRAWTDAQALKQWMAPSDAYTVLLAEADVRVGGRWRIVVKAPDGEEHDVNGVYREVTPNRKLVFTWAWKSTPERESLVSVVLRSAGSGTELTLTHEQFADAAARDRHQQGWDGCIARLERLLASSA